MKARTIRLGSASFAVPGAALLVAAVLLGAPGPVSAAGPAPVAATSGCSKAAGPHVAFVIDFGAAVARVCVGVPASDNDAEALATLSGALRWTPPRYAVSGLLCAIDGRPDTGCGTLSAGGYAYWSYWQGTAKGWSYGEGDPATTTVSPGTAVGWRFEPHGKANPTDPPPRGPSDPAQVCRTAGGVTASGPQATPAGSTPPNASTPTASPVTCSSVTSSSPTSPSTTTPSTTSPSTTAPPPTTAAPSSTTSSTAPGTTPVPGSSTTTTSSHAPRASGRSHDRKAGSGGGRTVGDRTARHRRRPSTPRAATTGVGDAGTATTTRKAPHAPTGGLDPPKGAPGELALAGSPAQAGRGPAPYIVVAAIVAGLGLTVILVRRRRRLPRPEP